MEKIQSEVFHSTRFQNFLIGSRSIQGWNFQSNGSFELVGIEFVSQRNMRGLPATAVHDFCFRRASVECHFRGLVRNAFMRDVVLGEESLQVLLRGGGADGLVKNRDGMAGLAS